MSAFYCLVPTSAAGPLRCLFSNDAERAIRISAAAGHAIGVVLLCTVVVLRRPYLQAWIGLRLPLLLVAYGLAVCVIGLADGIAQRLNPDSDIGESGDGNASNLVIAALSTVPCVLLLLALVRVSVHCKLAGYRRHTIFHRVVLVLSPLVGFFHFLSGMLGARFGAGAEGHGDGDGEGLAYAEAEDAAGLTGLFGPSTLHVLFGVLAALQLVLLLLLGLVTNSSSGRYNVGEFRSGTCGAGQVELQTQRHHNERLRQAVLYALLALAFQSFLGVILPDSHDLLLLSAVSGLAAYLLLCIPFVFGRRMQTGQGAFTRDTPATTGPTSRCSRAPATTLEPPLAIRCDEVEEKYVSLQSPAGDFFTVSYYQCGDAKDGRVASQPTSEWSHDSVAKRPRSRFGHVRDGSRSLFKGHALKVSRAPSSGVSEALSEEPEPVAVWRVPRRLTLAPAPLDRRTGAWRARGDTAPSLCSPDETSVRGSHDSKYSFRGGLTPVYVAFDGAPSTASSRSTYSPPSTVSSAHRNKPLPPIVDDLAPPPPVLAYDAARRPATPPMRPLRLRPPRTAPGRCTLESDLAAWRLASRPDNLVRPATAAAAAAQHLLEATGLSLTSARASRESQSDYPTSPRASSDIDAPL